MKRKNYQSLETEGRRLLTLASDCWSSASSIRRRRRRCRDFAFGRQWLDPVSYRDRIMTEHEWIIEQGGNPMQNNLIGRLVRNVLGVFRKRMDEARPDLSAEQKQIEERNNMKELYCRTMQDFLLSGMAVHRKWFGLREGTQGIWTNAVSPEVFFFNSDSRDPRGWDLTVVGQWHTVDFRGWCSEFVRTPDEYENALTLFPDGTGRQRIAEIWRREQRPRMLVHDPGEGRVYVYDVGETDDRLFKRNGLRSANGVWRRCWFLDDVWRFYFVAEDGTLLMQGDSPYIHGGHPYIVKFYPFIDGEIHSFVEDIIDQQKYTNHLITMYDWAVRASAKGVLLVPEGSVADQDMDQLCENWSRFDGVIRYKAKAGEAEPHQVAAGGKFPGISELLSIQLKMLEDVSGVTGTLQGNLSASTVSGTLYSQQTENALTSLRDLLSTFDSFIADCRRLDKLLLRQAPLAGYQNDNITVS